MGNKITVCHWEADVGHWTAITVSTNALKGHDNHELDIWAPFEGDPDGMNWPEGEAVYLNGCVLATTPEPSSSPTASGTASPSPTLPETGTGETLILTFLAIFLIALGLWMYRKGHLR